MDIMKTITAAQKKAAEKLYKENVAAAIKELVRDQAWSDVKKWMKETNLSGILQEVLEERLNEELDDIVEWAVCRARISIDDYSKPRRPQKKKKVKKKK
jgi:hypothetical protein